MCRLWVTVKKYGGVGQDMADNTIRRMRFACMMTKAKGRVWGFSALQPVGRLYPCPNEFPSFISRGATHHIGTRELC